jgi:hypothetical protein
MKLAKVIVNGKPLSIHQTAALRVALGGVVIELQDIEPPRSTALDNYLDELAAIIHFMDQQK